LLRTIRYQIHEIGQGLAVDIQPKLKKVHHKIQQIDLEAPPSPLISSTDVTASTGTPSVVAIPPPIRLSTVHTDSMHELDLKAFDEFDLRHSLQSILIDDGLLDLFAKHMVKEFCAESLMALIEMQQFKSYLKEQLKVDDEVKIVRFSPNVPRSEIVYREVAADLQAFKQSAYELFKKYVESGSEFEINISCKMRNELADLMGEHEAWMAVENPISADELVVVFNDTMREMMMLLRQSRCRFHDKFDGG